MTADPTSIAAAAGNTGGLRVGSRPASRRVRTDFRYARRAGLSATRIDSAAALAPCLANHDAILICTQEGLTVELRDALLAYVRRQPSWAQLPFVLIVDAAQQAWKISASLEGLTSECNITILHRPMRHLEFFTAVEAAVRARRWQLGINAHLELQAELRRELNHRVKNTLSTILAIYRL